MIRIPRIIEPVEDEMFASWIIRLARENGISDTKTFIKAFLYTNAPGRRYSFPQMDHRVPFELFWRALEFVHNEAVESDLFIRTSTFTGTAPFMRKEQRQRYLNQAFYMDRKMEPLFSLPHGTIDGLYICPDCAEEELREKGYFTLHRAHHLPGVTVCHRHGRALGKIEEDYINIRHDRIPEHTPLPVPDPVMAHRYAVFAKAFMDEEPDCSQGDISGLILERRTDGMIPRMTKEGYSSLLERPENFLSVQLRSAYMPPSSATAVLMYLFRENAEDAVRTLREKKGDGERRAFLEKIEDEGYSLISGYRSDIVTLCHDSCGETFCTSPYGFLVGWRCPSCGRDMTLQEQYEELVKNTGNGEYAPMGAFTGMDSKISLLHSRCGKKLSVKARAFLNEGVRCDCGSRVGLETARAEVEKNEGFTLVEYTGTDRPVKIRHSCGGEFSIYYEKFLQTPRCRVCQRQGHLDIRTTDDLARDIADLTGDEYTLLDAYEGARTPVRIRHNSCGTVQEYSPHRFLDGQRCRKCRKILTDSEFRAYVGQCSFGRYEVTERPTKNLYRIHDSVTDTDREMPKAKILQELSRPTPSLLLPLEDRDDAAPMRAERKTEALLAYLSDRFGDGLIFTEDIKYGTLHGDELHTALSNLVKRRRVRHLAKGIYTMSEREFSDKELIMARYVERYGHRTGFLRGQSYAGMIGIADEPEEWHIATNKESAKTANRKTKFLGQSIHIKGTPEEVTDKNCLILETADFLVQFRQYTDLPAEDVVNAVRRHLLAENGGSLPDRKLFDELVSGYRTANIRTMMNRLIDMLYGEERGDAEDN